MRRLLSRTSITIDEAVSILLGRSTGPIDFEAIDEAEDAEANCPTFCLRETLEDELEVFAGEHDLAKHEERAAPVIAEKLAALQHHEAVMAQADVYRCAIADELNKGEQSVLKVDNALSNAACAYVTLHSFNEWRKRIDGEGRAGEQPGAEVPAASVPVPVKPRTNLLQQEDAILAEIRQLNLDPLALPRIRHGHPGLKAAIRGALGKLPLFKGTQVFDKAWQRLLDQKRMVYSSGPSSPQKLDGGDL